MDAIGTERWRVQLIGNTIDLEDLAVWLIGSDFQIFKEGDEFQLASNRFDHLESSEDVRRIALETVKMLNGLGTAISPNFIPVSVGNTIWEGSERKAHTMVIVHSATVRVRMSAVVFKTNGSEKKNIDEGLLTSLLPQAFSSDRIQRVSELLGQRPLTWNALYKAYEVVLEDMGSAIYKNGWISKRFANRFCQTANSYSLIGFEARHAVKRYDSTTKPVSFREGRSAVLHLVKCWLDSKRSA